MTGEDRKKIVWTKEGKRTMALVKKRLGMAKKYLRRNAELLAQRRGSRRVELVDILSATDFLRLDDRGVRKKIKKRRAWSQEARRAVKTLDEVLEDIGKNLANVAELLVEERSSGKVGYMDVIFATSYLYQVLSTFIYCPVLFPQPFLQSFFQSLLQLD